MNAALESTVLLICLIRENTCNQVNISGAFQAYFTDIDNELYPVITDKALRSRRPQLSQYIGEDDIPGSSNKKRETSTREFKVTKLNYYGDEKNSKSSEDEESQSEEESTTVAGIKHTTANKKKTPNKNESAPADTIGKYDSHDDDDDDVLHTDETFESGSNDTDSEDVDESAASVDIEKIVVKLTTKPNKLNPNSVNDSKTEQKEKNSKISDYIQRKQEKSGIEEFMFKVFLGSVDLMNSIYKNKPPPKVMMRLRKELMDTFNDALSKDANYFRASHDSGENVIKVVEAVNSIVKKVISKQSDGAKKLEMLKTLQQKQK